MSEDQTPYGKPEKNSLEEKIANKVYDAAYDKDGDMLMKAREILAIVRSEYDGKHAAGPWRKFDPDPTLLGNIGEREWCLWSMVISGERNTFSGSWLREGDGSVYINWQGGPAVLADDSVYWARVNHVEEAR